MRRLLCAWCVVAALCLLTGGIALMASPPSAEPDAEPLREPAGCWHVVDEGENLRVLARRYYGSGRLWRTIQLANDVGQYPEAGRRVWIPAYWPGLP